MADARTGWAMLLIGAAAIAAATAAFLLDWRATLLMVGANILDRTFARNADKSRTIPEVPNTEAQ